MPLWGKSDAASNSALYALSQVQVTANTTNQAALYGNTTANAYFAGVAVGQFGVSAAEVQAAREEGLARPQSPGWALRTAKGSRVMFETLVAMSGSGGISTDGSDDAVLPDFKVRIRTQPANDTANSTAGETATFSVSAYSVPAGATLVYQWEADLGGGFAALTANATFTNVDTSTLTVANTAGLNNTFYRVAVGGVGGSNTISNAALLTVTT
jgi:hypothetical protein